MNKEYKQRTGGASITPSARKSIHSHNRCPFLTLEVMGRYGLDNKNNVQTKNVSPGSTNEGVDEVDNVMSKFARPSSPLLMKRKNGPRRNSLSPDDRLETEDDSDGSDALAKSLPATLPSYCSDEYGYWSINSDQQNRTHELSTEDRTPQSNRYRYQRSTPVKSTSPFNPVNVKTQNKKTSKGSIMLVPLIGILGVVTALYSNILNIMQGSTSIIYDELEFNNDLSGLGRKYKISDDSILQVQTGISTIYKRQDAGSFIFTYNSNMKHFNQIQFNKFMNDIATTAARYLRNDSTTVQHIVVDSASLDMQSHGELIQRYKDDVDKSGVMLVKELDGVPPDLAMAFHYYCDEYNPLVKKSAIFFTLNLAKCSGTSGSKSILAYIEKCLKKKWNGGVPPDNIGPLLTRVVASVIDVSNV